MNFGIRDWSYPGPDSLTMSLYDVSKFFGVDERTIERWIAEGAFPQGRGVPPIWTGGDIGAYLHLRGRWFQKDKKKERQNPTKPDAEATSDDI